MSSLPERWNLRRIPWTTLEREPLFRVIAPVLLANLVFFGLAALTLYQSHRRYDEQATQENQNLAYTLEANVSGVLDRISITLASIASEAEGQLATGSIRPQVLNAFIDRQRDVNPEIDSIRVSDASGRVIYGVDEKAEARFNISDREYFARARDSALGHTIRSAPIVSRLDGRLVIVLARAVRRPDGAVAAVVTSPLPVSYFTELIAAIDVGKRGVVAIRDGDLTLLARKPLKPESQHLIGTRDISMSAAAQMTLPGNGEDAAVFDTVSAVDQISRKMVARRTQRWSFFIFVGKAHDEYLASWYLELAGLIVLGTLLSVLSALFAVGAVRRRNAEVRAMEDLRSSAEHLERSETKFRALYDATTDAVVILGPRGFIDCNPAALRLFGVPDKDRFLLNRPGMALSPPTQPCGTDSKVLAERHNALALEQGNVSFEWMHRRVDTGVDFPAEVVLTAITLDGVRCVQGVVRDITERKQTEAQIRELAYFDALTRLPNRRLLMDRLAQALLASRRSQHYGALMILDLDNFKGLNDTRGHDVGDRLLVDVAQRIVSCVRREDTVARLGGDEFVIMASDLGTDQKRAEVDAEAVAEKILRVLAQTDSISGTDAVHHTTASIGVTLFCGADTTIEVLLKHSDLALYQAKAAGRNTFRFFNPQMQSTIDARTAMEAALHEGLRRGEFQLYYQPQFDQDRGLTGAEALLRWIPADRPAVSPAEFIPVAEDTGLIIPLGLWVLQSACAQLSAWARHPVGQRLSIAINVSARQFRQPDFAQQVRDCLLRSGANPALLKLELTESIVLDDIEATIARMLEIKALGVRFSLDDFGTGFSSLSYLKRLPLDQVKVDQAFVRDVVSDPNDGAIVRAIIAMCHSLGLQVIAEGVETPEQLNFLHEAGCRHYQGYLFGRPTPLEAWEPFLREAEFAETEVPTTASA